MNRLNRTDPAQHREGAVQTSREVNNAIHGLLERSRRVKITGLEGQNSLSVGISGEYEINAVGNVGSYLGSFNEASVIILRGKCGDLAGDSMLSGGLVIEGDCGRDCGLKLRGGIIVVKGTSGTDPGRSMTGGTIIIAGDVNGDACPDMEGGTMIIAGNLTGRLGPLHNGGTVLIAGSVGISDARVQEVPMTDKDMGVLDTYFKHYMIDAVPRTFRKFKTIEGRSRSLPMSVHTDHGPNTNLCMLDEIGFTTSDLEGPAQPEITNAKTVIGKAGSTGVISLDEPFIADLTTIDGNSSDILLGMATACTMSKWPISLMGKVPQEMRELFTSQRTRVVYKIGDDRSNLDLLMMKGASILELPILGPSGKRQPELRKGKDIIELMSMLRELRPGPIMIGMRGLSVDNDMETVLLSEPDSVLLTSTRSVRDTASGLMGPMSGSLVPAIVSSNRHFQTMGARKKGVRLLVSGEIRGSLDALKLLCMGADGVDLGGFLLRDVTKECSGEKGLREMDWSAVGDLTVEAIGRFRNEVKEAMEALDLTSYSQLTPHRLVALTYNAASITGLPLVGYGSVLPMWMQ